MMRGCLALCLVLALAACGATTKPEYPGYKPEAYIGKKDYTQKNAPSAPAKQAAPKPAPQGDGEVCVGAFCSCASE